MLNKNRLMLLNAVAVKVTIEMSEHVLTDLIYLIDNGYIECKHIFAEYFLTEKGYNELKKRSSELLVPLPEVIYVDFRTKKIISKRVA